MIAPRQPNPPSSGRIRGKRSNEEIAAAKAATIAGGIPLTPLYSAEAEQAVLGSMIARPEVVIAQVNERLREADFFVPAHRTLFTAVNTLHDNQSAIDITTLHQHLTDQKLADAVGSPGIIAQVVAGVPSHLNVGTYINIVREKSVLRSLQEACAAIAQQIAEGTDGAAAVLDQAEQAIFQITNTGLVNTTVAAKDEIARAVEMVEQFQKHRGQLFGIPTGFRRLNEMTTGWQKGDMIVLAARPGVGKTALALTFARHALDARYDKELDAWVKPGHAVGFFSLEMTNEQLMLRLLASYSNESLQKIRQGELDEQALKKLQMVGEDMKEWPLVLDDSSYLTIHQLRGKARRMKDLYKIELLIVDYLQLLRSESEQARDNRQNEVAEISRGIKALAKELEIPIIVLAQLNRRSEEGKTEPALHNLRESGAIEQDADVVLLLHRPESGSDEDGGERPTGAFSVPYSLNIAKQRNGPTDKLDLLFHPYYTRFDDPVQKEAGSSSY